MFEKLKSVFHSTDVKEMSGLVTLVNRGGEEGGLISASKKELKGTIHVSVNFKEMFYN